MFPRREFIHRATVAAALFGVPLARAEQFFSQQSAPLPPRALLATDPRRYWSDLRRQWLLAPDRINLNCGSVGCVPMPVLRATIDHILYAEEFRDPEYPWFGYEESPRLKEVHEAIAAFLHVSRDELALVRNATEANNIVVNGLDLKPGDRLYLPAGRRHSAEVVGRETVVSLDGTRW